MVAAGWADLEVLLELDGMNHGSAFWALGPEAFGHIVTLLLVAEERFAKNAHEKSCLKVGESEYQKD
jgi:hypothetical protein